MIPQDISTFSTSTQSNVMGSLESPCVLTCIDAPAGPCKSRLEKLTHRCRCCVATAPYLAERSRQIKEGRTGAASPIWEPDAGGP